MKTTSILKNLGLAGLLFFSIMANAQKKDSNAPKKAHVLPVYIESLEFPSDTSFMRILNEAFTRHKVKLINEQEFDQLNKNEAYRVVALIKTRQDSYRSESELRALAAREQKFVCNALKISFQQKADNDSSGILSASFENTPCPPNLTSSRSSGEKTIELKENYATLREQVFALVDEILFSKWLK